MKTADFIREHSTFHEDDEWALSISDDMADVWEVSLNQGKHEWLLWIATRPDMFPESALRRLACRFVRETPLHDERTVWNLLEDERGRKAVEVAERYSDGKATEAELSAASAAAYDAAYDAASADAYADADHVAAYYAAYAAASYDAEAVWTASDAAASAAARAAARAAEAARAARATVCGTRTVGCVARAAAEAERAAAFDDARADAYAAQVQMIAQLGNPFRREPLNENR